MKLTADIAHPGPVIVISGASALAKLVVNHYFASFSEGELLIVEERAKGLPKLLKFARRRIGSRGYLSFIDALAMRLLESLLGCPSPNPRFGALPKPHLIVEDVNDPSLAHYVQANRPRLIILNLCSVLSRAQLERFSAKVVNVHPGINPRYRGAGGIWALYEQNFHLFGATLHWVDEGIDTGDPIAYAPIDPINCEYGFTSIVAAAQVAGAKLATDLGTGRPVPPVSDDYTRLESRYYPYPGLSTWLSAWFKLRRVRNLQRGGHT